MSQPYLIQLQPLGNFFFGGERTFGDDNLQYFVRSRYFPQQTTLLGMLRYKILEWKNLLEDRRTGARLSSDAIQWIGPSSFNGLSTNFGIIKALSALFLMLDGEAAWPIPMDYNLMYSEKGAGRHSVLIKGDSHDFLPQLEGFDPKEGISEGLLNHSGKYLGLESIFKKVDQVGIQKTTFLSDRTEEKKAFYKQTFIRLKNTKSAFAFILWLDKQHSTSFQAHISKFPMVSLGGERSMFRMQMKQIENVREYLTIPISHKLGKQESNYTRIILLSDAFVSASIFQNCQFAITQAATFRHIHTNVRATKYYNELYKHKGSSTSGIDKSSNINEKKLYKSRAYNLLKAGSVFYAKSADQLKAIKKILNKSTAFQMIGYNNYISVNGTQTPFYHTIN